MSIVLASGVLYNPNDIKQGNVLQINDLNFYYKPIIIE